MKTITCPKLIWFALLSMGVEALMFGLGVTLMIEVSLVGAIFCLFSLASIVYNVPFYIRVFLPVTMDKDGVHNCFCRFSWSEIESLQIEILDIKFINKTILGIKDSKISVDLGLMICLQKEHDAPRRTFYEIPKSYFKAIPFYPLKSCIFLPYNEKSVNVIKKLAPHLLEPPK